MHCLGKILKYVVRVHVNVLEVDNCDLRNLATTALWSGPCLYLYLCSSYLERLALFTLYRPNLSLYCLTMDGVHGWK